MTKRYPTKKFTLKVKMHCCYYPDTHNRCRNTATTIKSFGNTEGYDVIAYCESCLRIISTQKRNAEEME